MVGTGPATAAAETEGRAISRKNRVGSSATAATPFRLATMRPARRDDGDATGSPRPEWNY
jgi:hypothetical protein